MDHWALSKVMLLLYILLDLIFKIVVVFCYVITYYILAYTSAAYSGGGAYDRALDALHKDFIRILNPNEHKGLSNTDRAAIMTSKVQRVMKNAIENRLQNSEQQPRASGAEAQLVPTVDPTARLQQLREEGRRQARARAQQRHDKKRTDVRFVEMSSKYHIFILTRAYVVADQKRPAIQDGDFASVSSRYASGEWNDCMYL